jgi:hypothetical protein
MGWYIIRNPDGDEVFRVFAQTLEELAANTPVNHTVHPAGNP